MKCRVNGEKKSRVIEAEMESCIVRGTQREEAEDRGGPGQLKVGEENKRRKCRLYIALKKADIKKEV